MSLLGSVLHLGCWSSEDDRGRRVRLYDEVDHWILGGWREFGIGRIRAAIFDEESVGEYRAIVSTQGWTHWAIPVLVIVGAFSSVGRWIHVGVIVLCVFLLAWQFMNYRWGVGLSMVAFRRAMIRARRCPGCAYSMEGIAADETDGCAVCPECGGAWRMNECP